MGTKGRDWSLHTAPRSALLKRCSTAAITSLISTASSKIASLGAVLDPDAGDT